MNQEGERRDDDQPNAEESKSFWGDISSELVDHDRDAKWLKDFQKKVNVTKQEKVDIIKESLKKILGRIPNWKSQGPDLLQGFCLKNFSSLHGRVRLQLKECLGSGFVPSWLTRRRTALLRKTCLLLIWKLLSGVIVYQIYVHLESCYQKNRKDAGKDLEELMVYFILIRQ